MTVSKSSSFRDANNKRSLHHFHGDSPLLVPPLSCSHLFLSSFLWTVRGSSFGFSFLNANSHQRLSVKVKYEVCEKMRSLVWRNKGSLFPVTRGRRWIFALALLLHWTWARCTNMKSLAFYLGRVGEREKQSDWEKKKVMEQIWPDWLCLRLGRFGADVISIQQSSLERAAALHEPELSKSPKSAPKAQIAQKLYCPNPWSMMGNLYIL